MSLAYFSGRGRRGRDLGRAHVRKLVAQRKAVPVPVESKLVAGFKVEVVPCVMCGFSPVQLRTLRGSGRDEFAFTCPNDDCNEYWKSPASQRWQPTKQLAADMWNAYMSPPYSEAPRRPESETSAPETVPPATAAPVRTPALTASHMPVLNICRLCGQPAVAATLDRRHVCADHLPK